MPATDDQYRGKRKGRMQFLVWYLVRIDGKAALLRNGSSGGSHDVYNALNYGVKRSELVGGYLLSRMPKRPSRAQQFFDLSYR
jgi:hypothetical protein